MKKLSREHKRKIGLAMMGKNLGKIRTEETREKFREAKRDEKNPSWKGDKVGYFALHAWIRRKLGKAKKCEHCGIEKLTRSDGRNAIHWANRSGKYRRDIGDWMQLCRPCHWKYEIYQRKIAMLDGLS